MNGNRHLPARAYAPAGALAALGCVAVVLLGTPSSLAALGYFPVSIVERIGGDGDALAQWWRVARDSLLALVAIAVPFFAAYRLLPRRPVFAAAGAVTVRRVLNIAVAVAVVAPVIYAVTRLAWAAGIPLGISDEFMRENNELWATGAALALATLVGAFLTWGLTRPWGARVPRAVPLVGGRSVPLRAARNCAVMVGFAVLSAGAYFYRVLIMGDKFDIQPGAEEQLGAWLPMVFWPAWGVALIVAALAYAELRRRAESPRAADRGDGGRVVRARHGGRRGEGSSRAAGTAAAGRSAAATTRRART